MDDPTLPSSLEELLKRRKAAQIDNETFFFPSSEMLASADDVDDALDSLIGLVRERPAMTTATIAGEVLETADEEWWRFDIDGEAADLLATLLATAVQRLAQEQS
jgi:hypothetical protein